MTRHPQVANGEAMSNLKNLSGKAGEFLFGAELMRPLAGSRFLFDAYLIGGNEPTLDYIIYLVDNNGDRTGAFFFVQVKTTTTSPKPGTGYKVGFSADDVKRAQSMKTPFFVCAVDRSVVGSEKFFIKGVASTRTTGISRLSPVYDVSMDVVKLDLYNEVTRLWAGQTCLPLAKFI